MNMSTNNLNNLNSTEVKYAITDAEWKIMKVLWKKPDDKLNLGEIIETLQPETSWNVNTIRTLLVRLAEKNIVSAEKNGKNYKYSAAVKEEDCAIQETRTLLERVFGGSSSLLFSTLIKHGGISEKEQDEILNLIEEMKKEPKE
jgi:BlaI family penicillinase repressor